MIHCDPEKIERIILNLISNAIKFSNEGGEIFVNIQDMNEWLEISVRDNSVGIEKDHLDMIFDRFKQVDKSLLRNAEGTGIGLSLVKYIVVLPARAVTKQHTLLNRNMKNRTENIEVEFSDVYL